jgi:hypothetical protein
MLELYNSGSPYTQINSQNINKLTDINEVINLIKNGHVLILAGEERLLSRLPTGKWIGGTIPYFMSEKGGIFTKSQIFVTDITELAQDIKIKAYSESQIDSIPNDYFENGFSFILAPGFSNVLESFAIRAEHNLNFFKSPLVGWVTGVELESIDKLLPVVVDGHNKETYLDKLLIMHVKLPENLFARLEITNIFEPGDGDYFIFDKDSYQIYQCIINGEPYNIFSYYIREHNIDTRLPLVADYNGAKVNVSIKSVSDLVVETYAPVRQGVKYRFAKPLPDYRNSFLQKIPQFNTGSLTSFNCILNYSYGGLQGTKLPYQGPFTFGEIAYILLNQTMVNLQIYQR